jgi:hypothetical protein
MTREDWRRVEPVATQALAMSPDEQDVLLATAKLSEPIRQELLAALRRIVQSSSAVVSPRPTPNAAGDGRLPSASLPILQPRTTVDGGRFVVIRQIGRGGMGTVFLAQDTALDTFVALKVMPADDRLMTEARRAAACSYHPNVATIHNVLRTQVDGQEIGILVMEYVEGTPASRLLDDGPVGIARALRWTRQVAAAIAHAHDHHVLHCDLKPANIMITPQDDAKVLDFGIARAMFDPSDPSEPLRGTMPYMAPEQLVARDFSRAGDIYSLGVTLFELVSGGLPFDGDDAVLRLRIVVAPAPRLTELAPDTPADVEAAVECALEKSPEQRFRSARAFQGAIEKAEARFRKESAADTVWRRAAIAAACVGSIVLGIVALGALTSAAFNIKLGRSDFANEGLLDWLQWGRKTTVPVLIIFLAALLALAVTRLTWRLLVDASAVTRRVDEQMYRLRRQTERLLHLDDVSGISACALLVSLPLLAAAIWSFADLLSAFVAFAATGASEDLARLGPANVTRHNQYRGVFTGVVIVSGLVWYPVVKRAYAGRPVHPGSMLAATLIIGASLVLLHVPYRTLFSEYAGEAFQAVRWQGFYCYVLGERDGRELLLCPSLDPPRHRVVRVNDETTEDLGIREGVFNGFQREVATKQSTSGRIGQ